MSRWTRTLCVFSITLSALVLGGCGDDRPCLKSHYTYIPIYCGKGCMTIVPVKDCDKYGPKPTARPHD